MAKTVFDNSMVAHVWAQQNQPEGRSNNGNFWFEGRTIFSYRTPVAVIHPEAVLITSERYSVTTSGKHMPAIHRAVRGRSFTVPSIGATGGMVQATQGSGIDHLANLQHFRNIIANHFRTYLRARDVNEYVLNWARDAFATSDRYCEAFHLPPPSRRQFENDLASTIQARADKDERLNTPQAIAKRAKAKAQREAKEARKHEEQLAKLAAMKAEWLAGVQNAFRSPYGSAALLRVRGDVLETSQGASVPLPQAVAAFEIIVSCKKAGREWEARGGHTKKISVGSFSVDVIHANGNIRAGCHIIEWSEIERIAKQLGLIVEEQ